LYLENLEKVQIELTGADLVELGVPPGPEIGRALEAILERKLDGIIATRQDELEFVKDRFHSKLVVKESSNNEVAVKEVSGKEVSGKDALMKEDRKLSRSSKKDGSS